MSTQISTPTEIHHVISDNMYKARQGLIAYIEKNLSSATYLPLRVATLGWDSFIVKQVADMYRDKGWDVKIVDHISTVGAYMEFAEKV